MTTPADPEAVARGAEPPPLDAADRTRLDEDRPLGGELGEPALALRTGELVLA